MINGFYGDGDDDRGDVDDGDDADDDDHDDDDENHIHTSHTFHRILRRRCVEFHFLNDDGRGLFHLQHCTFCGASIRARLQFGVMARAIPTGICVVCFFDTIYKHIICI